VPLTVIRWIVELPDESFRSGEKIASLESKAAVVAHDTAIGVKKRGDPLDCNVGAVDIRAAVREINRSLEAPFTSPVVGSRLTGCLGGPKPVAPSPPIEYKMSGWATTLQARTKVQQQKTRQLATHSRRGSPVHLIQSLLLIGNARIPGCFF
jgi:hypothetical protein